MTDDGNSENESHRARLRFEAIFALAWVGFGAFLLPAMIYFVGTRLLGPYDKGAALDGFYADLFSDLAGGSVRAWLIVLGPYVAVMLLRAILFGFRGRGGEAADAHTRKRFEPTLD